MKENGEIYDENYIMDLNATLMLIFSGLVAVSTVVYACLTWKLVSETRRLRKVQTEPNVFINLQLRENNINFVDLIIQNIGNGNAHNIKFSVNTDYQIVSDKPIKEISIFKNGLDRLAPKQKIQSYVGYLPNINEDLTFDIEVNYENCLGKKYNANYPIIFSELIGLFLAGKPPIYEIAESLKAIETHLKKNIKNKPE
ncbi:MAG: hypothetical protein OEV44_12575 [Spirochaetota bacterium]|nr:hypothetical protein [Spirochaetota bacterium]